MFTEVFLFVFRINIQSTVLEEDTEPSTITNVNIRVVLG